MKGLGSKRSSAGSLHKKRERRFHASLFFFYSAFLDQLVKKDIFPEEGENREKIRSFQEMSEIQFSFALYFAPEEVVFPDIATIQLSIGGNCLVTSIGNVPSFSRKLLNEAGTGVWI
jgi:hypothetical protein